MPPQWPVVCAQENLVGSQDKDRRSPPSVGPMIDPIRPIPNAQPMPVDRISVGLEAGYQGIKPGLCPLHSHAQEKGY